MALEATVYVGIKAEQTTTLDLGGGTIAIGPNDTKITLENGTATGQASKIFSDQRTLAASATESLDLAASLVDALGSTLTFATIKAIYIKASADNTNDVIVGGAASNAFYGPFDAADNTVQVKPGGAMLLVAPKTGWAVTASTADILKIANSAGTTGVTYDVVLVGT